MKDPNICQIEHNWIWVNEDFIQNCNEESAQASKSASISKSNRKRLSLVRRGKQD